MKFTNNKIMERLLYMDQRGNLLRITYSGHNYVDMYRYDDMLRHEHITVSRYQLENEYKIHDIIPGEVLKNDQAFETWLKNYIATGGKYKQT